MTKIPQWKVCRLNPMVGANVKLQVSKEEFEKFMKIPIGNDEIEKTDTLNPRSD